jgi:protein TonB
VISSRVRGASGLLLSWVLLCGAGVGFAQASSNHSSSAPAEPLRVRISQKVSDSLIVKKVLPAYPKEARRKHIEGNVVMRAEINTAGDVTDLTVVSGDPLLAPAALEAVRQWKYRPYLLDNSPVNVETQVTVAFVLKLH